MTNPFTFGQFSKFDHPDKLRGVFGDHASYIDPYTTGYHYLMFTKLPDGLEPNYGKFLCTTCQAVSNIPGLTVNPIEYNGLNNLKWSVPGTVEFDSNRFTVKFTEFAGLPITTIFGKWVTKFRNIMYGIADDEGTTEQKGYKGKAIYCTTLWDGKTVQFAAAFSGIYPLKVPTDLFQSDRATQDKAEPEIEFSFDMMYTGESVVSSAKSLLDTYRNAGISAVDSMYSEAASSNNS